MASLPPKFMAPRPIENGESVILLSEVERAAQLGSFLWRPDQPAQWSDGFYRVLGLSPDAPNLLAAAFYDLVHPEDRQRVEAVWHATLQTGATGDVVYRILRPDGALRVLHGRCAATLDETGRVTRVVGTLFDITEHHEAERQLARAHALLADTERAAGVGSQSYDLASRRLDWSDEMFRLVGLDPRSKITPERVLEITHADDRARVNDWVSRLTKGQAPRPLVSRVHLPNGTLRYIESRGRLITTEEGPRISGVSMDVTARVILEEQLLHAAKMEAVGTLAAGIAHDFNNYLGAIVMQLNALELFCNGPASQALEGARHAAEQCASLTRQLLMFARKQETASQEIDLTALVQRAVPLVERLVGPSITLSAHLPTTPVIIRADPGQVEAALMNLALNARDAMERGGNLVLALDVVSLSVADEAYGASAAPGTYAHLRVSDTGVGIPKEHLPRIFDPYFTTKAPGKGTGLGLASLYGSVRQHGGFVRVESEVGRGTTFDLYLPIRSERRPQNEPARERRAPEPSTYAAHAGSVLLVDDTPSIRHLAVEVLIQAGYETYTAADGVAALALLRSRPEPLDVVVTDLTMPNMNGHELIKELRRISPRTRVVLMTGYLDAGEVGSASAHQPDVVLPKPFRPPELLEAVSMALAQAQGATPPS